MPPLSTYVERRNAACDGGRCKGASSLHRATETSRHIYDARTFTPSKLDIQVGSQHSRLVPWSNYLST